MTRPVLLFAGRCESPSGRAEDTRLEAYACPDEKCPGLCSAPDDPSRGSERSSESSRHGGRSPSAGLEEGNAQGNGLQTGKGRVDALREGDEDEELDLGARRIPLPEVLAGEEAEEEGPGCLKCGVCGNMSRSAEEARQKLEAIQELLDRGKALESDGQAVLARQYLEQALPRSIGLLHRGNWVLSEVYGRLASICVELQVSSASLGTIPEDLFRTFTEELLPLELGDWRSYLTKSQLPC